MIPPQNQPLNVKLRNQHICFGGIFVIAGIAMFVYNLMTIIQSDNFVNYKSGIWMGIFVTIAGTLSVIAAKMDNSRYVIGALVMDIVCSCLCWPVILLSLIEISARPSILNGQLKYNESLSDFRDNNGNKVNEEYLAFTLEYSFLMVLAMLVGFVLLIIHAGMSCFDLCTCCAECCTCCACCCRPTRPPPPLVTGQAQVITIQPGGGPVTPFSQGQVVAVEYPNCQYTQIPGQLPPDPVSRPTQPGYNPAYSIPILGQANSMIPQATPSSMPDDAPPSYEEINKQDSKLSQSDVNNK